MAKGDDIARRKKNKEIRKKQSRKSDTSSAAVSARIASLIAAKKRRQSGKRRKCQGMCFSLPTPDDPFNERGGKKDTELEGVNRVVNRRKVDDKKTAAKRGDPDGKNGRKADNAIDNNVDISEVVDCPSKYLIQCLNSIEVAMRYEGVEVCEDGKPLFVSAWGNEFWKGYSVGKDVLDSSGGCSSMAQIAWVASTAADAIARNEKEGMSLSGPYFLFLVPSKEKAMKVRSVCKPLKLLGIHTVSLHSDAPMDHQIIGLKSCEPEFVVSTPERLLELVSLDALNISDVSMLVVDGLESNSKDGYLDNIMSIRQKINGSPHTVVFNNYFSHVSFPVVQNLLRASICRISPQNSIKSQSACILQSVDVCVTEKEKLSKVIKVLEHAGGSQFPSQPLKALFIVRQGNKLHKLVTALKTKGHVISVGPKYEDKTDSMDVDSKVRPIISTINEEDIHTAALEEYEVVFLPDFVLAIENYTQILRKMARHTVRGVLQSFVTDRDARFTSTFIEILEQCEQIVPEALRKLCDASTMLEQHD